MLRSINRRFIATRGVDRTALERFLLKAEFDKLQGVETRDASDESDDIINAQVQLSLFPALDKEWMPKPLGYRKLKLEENYFQKLEAIQDNLKFQFTNRLLLLQAFTHPSAAFYIAKASYLKDFQQYRLLSNERLSVIGNTAFQFAMIMNAYHMNPQMSNAKANTMIVLLKQHVMFESIARELGIEELIITRKVEDVKGFEAEPQSHISAEALRALIGATYLDKGFAECNRFIIRNILPGLEDKLLKAEAARQKIAASERQ